MKTKAIYAGRIGDFCDFGPTDSMGQNLFYSSR
jgi:hypothetical protein